MEYASGYEDATAIGASPLTADTDSFEVHGESILRRAFPFSPVSDEENLVNRRYGAMDVIGQAKRGVFGMDGNGIIHFTNRSFPFLHGSSDRMFEAPHE